MVIGRMISCSFCWAIIKKMTKKWDLDTSNEETGPKIGIYVKNWARQALLKFFDFGQSQRSTARSQSTAWDTDVAVWRHSKADVVGHDTRQARGSAWGRCSQRVWRVWKTNDTCLWGRNFSRRVWGGFWPFLVGFCSRLSDLSIYALILVVWSTKLTKSECSRGCGRDDGDSLLIVTIGWRQGQRKNARDVHMNHRVREKTLIPC